MDNLHYILKKYWGYEQFRELQEDIIHSVLDGKDTLGLMPTGGGKSLTFQIPTLCMDGLCIVITPLIALMKDQVQNLNKRHIKATAIYSGMTSNEIDIILNNCYYGNYKFLYLSPERLKTKVFINKISTMKICLITVDESHCISQWGYDFRPSYLKIAEIRDYIPNVPILALTASATTDVVKDIQLKLKFKKENVFKKSFKRKNLAYIVRKTDDKLFQILKILNNVPGSSIIYVRSRKKTKEISDFLNQNNIKANIFHAGMDYVDKDKNLQLWQNNNLRVIVATNAFGMGIDKPNVRTVIHVDLPDSLEAYFQEAGRAGRDNKKAFAILLYNNKDDIKIKKRQKDNFPPIKFIKSVYDKLAFYFTMGIGCGENCILPFNLLDFCQKFHINSLATFNAIKILESSGYIILTEKNDNPSRLMIIENKNELYNANLGNHTRKIILEAILRLYSGIFSQYIHINEDLIANYTENTRQTIYNNLIELDKLGILSYIPAKKTPFIIYTINRVENKDVKISKESYKIRKDKYIERTSQMLNYAKEKDLCRSRFLMNYFGQKDADNCNSCDICIEHKKNRTTDNQKIIIYKIEKLLIQQHKISIEEIISRIDNNSDEIISAIRLMADNGIINIDRSNLILNK